MKGFGAKTIEKKQKKINFLTDLLKKVIKSKGSEEDICTFINADLDAFDEELARAILHWANEQLINKGAVVTEKYLKKIEAITNFSRVIHNLSKLNARDRIEIAIASYKVIDSSLNRLNWQLIQMKNPAAFPNLQQWWVSNQNNLGSAYKDRVRGDLLENLEKAENCYSKAQQFFTYEKYSQEWAKIRTNQGVVYRQKLKIDLAIAAHLDAVTVLNEEQFPKELAEAHRNLGAAYLVDSISNQFKDSEKKLERATHHLETALSICKRYSFDELKGSIQLNLAGVYDKAKNYQQAIDASISSLQIYSYEDFPEKWAKNQLNLGRIYANLNRLDDAIRCYELALQVFKPSLFPVYACEAGTSLGDLAFKEKQWEKAIAGYTVAIEAVETSRGWASQEERRQKISEEAFGVYQKMVQACIEAGNIETAFETIERSRSKRLQDLIVANEHYFCGNLPLEVQQLQHQYEELQKQIDQERHSITINENKSLVNVDNSRCNRISLKSSQERIVNWEEQQQRILGKIRKAQYSLLAAEEEVRCLKASQIQELVEESTTAILSFYLIKNVIYIFILRQNKLSLHVGAVQDNQSAYYWLMNKWTYPYTQGNRKNQ